WRSRRAASARPRRPCRRAPPPAARSRGRRRRRRRRRRRTQASPESPSALSAYGVELPPQPRCSRFAGPHPLVLDLALRPRRALLRRGDPFLGRLGLRFDLVQPLLGRRDRPLFRLALALQVFLMLQLLGFQLAVGLRPRPLEVGFERPDLGLEPALGLARG